MASLKDLRVRIGSVKSTQKITSAMKMVAAAKLRRAQEQAEASRPFSDRMGRMLANVASSAKNSAGAPRLLSGTGSDQRHLIIVATGDRGLCGGFNSGIAREARRTVEALKAEGKTVQIVCVGRKGRDVLRRLYGDLIIDTIEDVAKPALTYDKAEAIGHRVVEMFEADDFDVCQIVYARFKSAMTQIVTREQLIPFVSTNEEQAKEQDSDSSELGPGQVYDYEPEQEEILAELLPLNISVQIYKSLLENNASEQGARMTAMDSATRNAGDMIKSLTLTYNRTRQAQITKELIEIISASEAM